MVTKKPKTLGKFGTPKKKQLGNYVKRLGQHHYHEIGDSKTLCGMPMLGNNYARMLPRTEWETCKECKEKAKKFMR